MDDLVDTVQMHLKALLELQEAGAPARRIRIAERLHLAGPTVTKTIARMERDGLVAFREENKQLSFTPAGYSEAIRVMRRHRLGERFLQDVVGLEWEFIHDEACRLEHVMSDKTADLLAELLKHPTTDPYGNPIPEWDEADWDVLGMFPEVDNLVRYLSQHNDEAAVEIAWIGEVAQSDPNLLSQLRRFGVTPGRVGVFALHGPGVLARFDPDAGPLELPHRAAAQLFVRAIAIRHDPHLPHESNGDTVRTAGARSAPLPVRR